MIYQMPCPGKTGVFVASSAPAEEQACWELENWASGNGYPLTPAPRIFTVYGSEQQTRRWMLLERREQRK